MKSYSTCCPWGSTTSAEMPGADTERSLNSLWHWVEMVASTAESPLPASAPLCLRSTQRRGYQMQRADFQA